MDTKLIFVLLGLAVVSVLATNNLKAPLSKRKTSDIDAHTLIDLIALVKKENSFQNIEASEVNTEKSKETGANNHAKRGLNFVHECGAKSGSSMSYTLKNVAGGYLQSANYGKGKYSDTSKCKWTITVPGNKKVKIHFSSPFDIEAKDSSTCYDGLTITKGILSGDNYDHLYCGTDTPNDVYIASSTFTIVFHADQSTTGKGFKLRFAAVDSASDSIDLGINSKGCGTTRFDKRIMNGDISKHGEWPWIAHLKTWTSSTTAMQCGGTLISNRWIVTAAHCLENNGRHITDPNSVSIYLSEHNTGNDDWTQYQVKASKIIISPDRTSMGVAPNDIAMIKLTEPVQFTNFVNEICLPEKRGMFSVGQDCVVAGWGKTHRTESVSAQLLDLDMELITWKKCHDTYGPSISNDVICALRHQDLNKVASSCQGDSGGPLMCKINGKYVLAGAVSFGAPCGQYSSAMPTAFASIRYFYSWIQTTIAEN